MDRLGTLELPAPRIVPELDPRFRPAVLAERAYRERVAAGHRRIPVGLALEQADGSVFHGSTEVLAGDDPFAYLERRVKFLLWSRGGWRIHVAGPREFADALARHFRETPTGRFDSQIIGEKIYDHPIEVVSATALPPERSSTASLGRHLDGCRIGFDLGGSDRKVAAVIDGNPVFTEETVWDPYPQADPRYHVDGIRDSLRRAAEHLPRVDAIGGSAAGCYVNNRVKVASLFRGVPAPLFERHVRDLFIDLRKEWGGVPFDVVNDGEVTALAGSMSLGDNAVLGIALGTSTAGGYVTPEGKITSWLNELAFVPVDYHPEAPVDEWSGDRGCGAQYYSQQAVGRLLGPAGISVDPKLPLPEKLRHVQDLMAKGDERARRIYRTLGVYLGYGTAQFADAYDFRHVLVLGRVTSGAGGDLMVETARGVLRSEFPELAGKIRFSMPDEKDRRHGQAVAAASLPELRG
jgi:predicted NBD/HSP70 family sugar kinase